MLVKKKEGNKAPKASLLSNIIELTTTMLAVFLQ